MPVVSRFLGIHISIQYNDHSPPHFHAVYGDYKIIVEIQSGIIEGKFPKRALSAVLEWSALHAEELLRDWDLAKSHMPLNEIPPLE